MAPCGSEHGWAACAGDGEAGVKLIQATKPHMALLDLDIPQLDGFEVIRRVQQLQTAVDIIFLTIHSEVDLLHRALELGAKGYILKESALLEIVSGVRSIAAGKPYVSPSLTPALLKRRTVVEDFERGNPKLSHLTPAGAPHSGHDRRRQIIESRFTCLPISVYCPPEWSSIDPGKLI